MLLSTSFDGTTLESLSQSSNAAVAAEFERPKGNRFTAAELGALLWRNIAQYDLIAQPLCIAHGIKNSVTLSNPKKPSSKWMFEAGDDARVFVTVHLEKDQLSPKDLAELKKWLLSNVPTEVNGMNIEVEDYFHGLRVLLLNVSLEIWGIIGFSDAFQFTANVKLRNLLISAAATQSLSIRGAENVKSGLLKRQGTQMKLFIVRMIYRIIKVLSLCNNGRDAPEYEALSYEWGAKQCDEN